MITGMSGPTPNAVERSEKIRIVIADDHPIVRDGLKKLLSLEHDFEIVGEAVNGQQAINIVHRLQPDILLLDLRMPELDGMATLQALQSDPSRTKVIILTASEERTDFVQAMRLGSRGILLKQTSPDLIIKSIRKVHAGEIWMDTNTTSAVIESFANGAAGGPAAAGPAVKQTVKAAGMRDRTPLSARELEIVQYVAQGYKNKEMAEKMFISEQTVKNHLHNIFDKLGVSDRLELALFAIHNNLHVGASE
jgi:two-component system nitrate/nitrite response regulator NarL